MKLKLWTAAVCTGAGTGLLMAFLCSVPAGAQSPPQYNAAPPTVYTEHHPPGADTQAAHDPRYVAGPSVQTAITAAAHNGRIAHVLNTKSKLAAAKTEADKKAIVEELEKALAEYFDADMKTRTTELDVLKKKLADMEAYLGKRSKAKKDIVKLQLESYKHEAEGMGLFPEETQAFSFHTGTIR